MHDEVDRERGGERGREGGTIYVEQQTPELQALFLTNQAAHKQKYIPRLSCSSPQHLTLHSYSSFLGGSSSIKHCQKGPHYVRNNALQGRHNPFPLHHIYCGKILEFQPGGEPLLTHFGIREGSSPSSLERELLHVLS